MAIQGYLNWPDGDTTFATPVYLNTIPAVNDYPNGTVTFDLVSDGNAYWKNNNSSYAISVDLYLCDQYGNNRVYLTTVSLGKGGTSTTLNSATITNGQALTGTPIHMIGVGEYVNSLMLRRYTTITINTATATHSVGVYTATGGSGSVNKTSAAAGETVTYTASPSTGYSASAPTSGGITFTAAGTNKWTFTMPDWDVNIQPHFSKINYTVSVSTTPSGGGSASLSKTTANYGDQITVTATPSAGWKVKSITTSPAATVSNNKFTMPASNTTVTVTFEKIVYSITISSGSNTDPKGTLTANKSTATVGETVVLTVSPNTGVQLSSFTKSPSNLAITNNTFTMPASNVSITAVWAWITRTITVSAGTGGSLTASKSTAHYGEQITLTPTANTGYQFSSYTKNPNNLSISANKFTMPNSNVTITASFSKISYSITKSANPTGAGTVTTGANSANYQDQVTVSQTPATGYYFKGWTITPSGVTVSNGKITMPAANVSIVANYLKRSTGSLSKTSMNGGDTVTLTISPDKSTYSHKYKLSFGSNMETSLTTVNAGTTSVNISVPLNWCDQIPNATQKTGGTLLLETYNGTTKIGEYTISSLTYNVPSSVKPSIGTITTSIARTIDSVTYADVGNYYVQGKCGVRIQTTASGDHSSTISSLKVEIGGYSGSNYSKTVNAASIDFTSKLLTINGSTTITVTATDSRGRTNTKTATITVTKYTKPSGSLNVWRVDANGDADTMGEYGKYSQTNSYTNVGSNSLTVTLRSQNTNENSPAASGNLLPTIRQTFNITQEYSITLTLADLFETVVITEKVPTAQFMMYFNPDGDRMAFMKAVNTGLSKNGKNAVIEFSENAQMYIGSTMLEQYMQNCVSYVDTANKTSYSVPAPSASVYQKYWIALMFIQPGTGGIPGIYVIFRDMSDNIEVTKLAGTTDRTFTGTFLNGVITLTASSTIWGGIRVLILE